MSDIGKNLTKLKSEILEKVYESLQLADPSMHDALLKSNKDFILEVQLVEKSSFEPPHAVPTKQGAHPMAGWSAFCKNGLCQVYKDPPGICIVFKDPTV